MGGNGTASRTETTAWGTAFLVVGLTPLLPPGRWPGLAESAASTWLAVAALSTMLLPRRARFVGLVACVTLAVTAAWGLATGADPFREIGLLVAAAVLAVGTWRLGRVETTEPREPIVSLVVLLDQPARLESTLLAMRASEAWEIEVGTEEDENESAYAVGLSPHFLVKRDEWLFAVHDVEGAYFDDADRVARYTPDWRERRIVVEHRAWMSVDLLYAPPDSTDADAYRLIGRLLAELAPAEARLGVLRGDGQRVQPWNVVVDHALRAEDPGRELATLAGAGPLVVQEDDPRVQAAIATARSRWQEFVGAFEKRLSDSGYAVKVPIDEAGETEFRWVNVTAIENDIVYAVPPEEMVGGRGRRGGGLVRTPVGDVVDWLVEANGQRRGGFTLEVFREVADEQRRDADAFESS